MSDKILEDDSPFPKHAILQILRVMQIVLENCHNKGSLDGLEVWHADDICSQSFFTCWFIVKLFIVSLSRNFIFTLILLSLHFSVRFLPPTAFQAPTCINGS